MRGSTYDANLVIRLLGTHDLVAQEAGSKVQVTLPGAVITLADGHAASAVYMAWVESERIARQAFTGAPVSHRLYERPKQHVAASVLISGRQDKSLVITGRAPEHSPSGAGQVAIRFGAVTIVCDDRAAWESLHLVWVEAYRIAATIWRIAAPHIAAGKARSRPDRWNVTGPKPRR